MQPSDLDNAPVSLTAAPPEVQEIVKRVLQLEKEKLYLKNPRNINDDVLQIVKAVVQ